MNVGAVVGFYQDMSTRRALLRMVHEPEMGFAERGEGVWTWTFKQNELLKAVEAPSGSAVHIAGVMGFPFIRLRAALPDELFAGSVAQSLGRRDGMSVTGLVASREENVAVMMTLRRGMSCFACGPKPSRDQIPALFADDEQDSKGALAAPRAQSLVRVSRPSRETPAVAGGGSRRMLIFDYDSALSATDLEEYTRPPDPHEMVGTALMFAFLANQHVLPVMELSVRIAAAKEHFRGVRMPGIDHEFESLLPKFMTMLGEEGGALTARAKWMATTRLWRLIFLQREEGCFDMTDSLAFALEAHEGQPPPKKRKERKGLAALAALCLGDGDLEDDLDDAADEAMDTDDEEPAADEKQTETHQEHHQKRVKDCPISFSAAAMRHRIPAALLALNDTYDDPALQRQLSRLTMRAVSGITLPDTPRTEHPEAPELVDESEPDAASATNSTHGPAEAPEDLLSKPSEAAAESPSEPTADAPSPEPAAKLEPDSAASSAELAAADPLAESAEPADSAASEAAAESPIVETGVQPSTASLIAEPTAAEPAPVVITSGAVWSGADGYGARSTLVNGHGAHGTPSRAATTVSEAVSKLHRSASGMHTAPARPSADAPRAPVERIWATLLAIKVLEGMDVCWLVDDEPEEGEERTIVDAAREWLEAQGEADERVAELLESGKLSRAADKTIASWKAIMEHNIAEVRRLDVLNRFTALTHLQRATGRIIKSVMTDHGAFDRVQAVVHACRQVCRHARARLRRNIRHVPGRRRLHHALAAIQCAPALRAPPPLRPLCLHSYARCLHSAVILVTLVLSTLLGACAAGRACCLHAIDALSLVLLQCPFGSTAAAARNAAWRSET